jgi:murein L,D-transpeptidase YafK
MRRHIATTSAVLRISTVLIALAAASGDFAAQELPRGTVADRILVEKSARTLSVFRGDTLLKTYKVALGRNPKGPKQREGDGRTPEGTYVIDSRKADSKFHRALHISYPNAEDRRQARLRRVSPGGAIMIHGLPNGMGALGKSHLMRDWTDGCIAVTNTEIEELWRLIPNGTRIEIKP